MHKWKQLLKRLLSPPVWQMIVYIIISATALAVVFLKEWERHFAACFIYIFSFYTLTVTCLYCVDAIPRLYCSVRKQMFENKFGNRYMTDIRFKTSVSLYRSLGINLLYVAVNLVSGLLHKSAWFVLLAAYYIILSAMRFLLVRFVGKIGLGNNRMLELRRARLCGVILMLVNFALSGSVLMMMYQGRGFEYGGILIYAVALYTFYITVVAIVDMLKFRKYQSPVMSTAKVINLTAALVSMLSLETAMLTQFGKETMAIQAKRALIAATGAGVSVVVIALSIYTIWRATKELHAFGDRRY